MLSRAMVRIKQRCCPIDGCDFDCQQGERAAAA
jgi:hypothetical protein